MAERVCPPWIGYLLASPARRLFNDPKAITGPYVRRGMTVLDVGPALGFFSLPLARAVGPTGRVICVDLQKPMIQILTRRVKRAGLSDRVEGRVCSDRSLEIGDLAGAVDFALAFAMVHEVPDPDRLFDELYAALAPGGRLLVAEPKFHVSGAVCDQEMRQAQAAGFAIADRPKITRTCNAVLLEKPRA